MPTYKPADLSETPSPERINPQIQDEASARLYEAFTKHGITCVFFGGYGLKLLGNTRMPGDADCCVDVRLKDVLERLKVEPE